MYKVSNNISPTILNDILASKATPYNLRNPVSFKMRKVYLVYSGTETLPHLGPTIWSLVPQEIRHSVSLVDFKLKIIKWTPSNCSYRLCKNITSNMIHLKRFLLTSLAAVSTIIIHISNI